MRLHRRQLLFVTLLFAAVNASAHSTAEIANVVLDDIPTGLIDLYHIERNASYTTLGGYFAFTEKIIGYASWDTDRDGVLTGLYVSELSEKVSWVGALGFKSNKAGNDAVTAMVHFYYALGNGTIGAGLNLEKGTNTEAAMTVGKQDTLTYRLIGMYDFSSWNVELTLEKFDYRNPTYKEINRRISDENTSANGLSALTIEGQISAFGNVLPYALVKLKEFEGPLDDTEVRIGVRWMF